MPSVRQARVKAALPEGVPVGCVDAYFQFLERPALTAACDKPI